MRTLPHTISARLAGMSILACAGCTFVFTDACSQGLYNESSLHINGADIHVEGEIHNDGTLENNGLLAFTGDWESEGRYKGKGTLEVNGTMPQKISHFDQEVAGLVINGWGTTYVKGKMNVSNALHLTQGIVKITPKDVFRLREKAVISGGSARSYVDGALTVEGGGYKFFPLGKDGTYAPIEFLNVEGKLMEYSVEVFENAPVVSVENIIVRSELYWQRKDVYGEFGGSPVAVQFNPQTFGDPDNILLVEGTDWANPFTVISDVEKSAESNKIFTSTPVFSPLLMLGEAAEKWNDADFYFSTALSPHAGYSENRMVKVFGERLREGEFHFQVFTRWGELVYESHSLQNMKSNGWDGRRNDGKQLAGGTYPYRLAAYERTGQKIEKKGVITIIY